MLIMHTLVEANTRAINETLGQYLEFEELLRHHQDKVPEHCLVFPELNLNFRSVEMCALNLKSYQNILTQMHQLIGSDQAPQGFRFEGGDETSSTVLNLFKTAGLIKHERVCEVQASLLQGQHGIIYLDGRCYHFRLTTPIEISNWEQLIECIQHHRSIDASQLTFNEQNSEIAGELLLNWNEKIVIHPQDLEQVSHEGTEDSLDQLDHQILLRKYSDLNEEIRKSKEIQASLATSEGVGSLQALKETFITMIRRKHKPEVAEKLCARMSAHTFSDTANIVNDLTDYANEQLASIIQEDMIMFEFAQINDREILEGKTKFKDPESDFKQFLTFTLSDHEGTEGSLDQLDHQILLRKYSDLNEEIRKSKEIQASLATSEGVGSLPKLKETFITMIRRKHKPEVAENLCARMLAHSFSDSANIVDDLTHYANKQLTSIIQEEMITSTAMTAFINAEIFHETVHAQPTPKLNEFVQDVASRAVGDPDPVILIPILSGSHYTGFKVHLRTRAIQYFDSLPKSSYSQALEKAPGNTPDGLISPLARVLPLARALLFGAPHSTEDHALTVTNESRQVRWSNTCADRLLNWLLGEEAPDSEIDQMIERLERIPARKKIPLAGFEDTLVMDRNALKQALRDADKNRELLHNLSWSRYADLFISNLSDKNDEQQQFKAQLEAAKGQLTQAEKAGDETRIEASATEIKNILVSYFKYVRDNPERFQLQHRTFKPPKDSIQNSQHSGGQLLKNKGPPQNSKTPKEPNQQNQAIDEFQRLELSPINSSIDHENSDGFIGLLIIGLICLSSGIASLMQDSTSLTALHGVMNTGFIFLAIGALILLSLLADHIACYSMANQSNRVSMKWFMLFSSLMTCASMILMCAGVQAHLISISWMSSGSLPIALITLAGYLFSCGCLVSIVMHHDSSKLNPSSDTSTYEKSMNLGEKPTNSPANVVVNQLHASQSPSIQ